MICVKRAVDWNFAKYLWNPLNRSYVAGESLTNSVWQQFRISLGCCFPESWASTWSGDSCWFQMEHERPPSSCFNGHLGLGHLAILWWLPKDLGHIPTYLKCKTRQANKTLHWHITSYHLTSCCCASTCFYYTWDIICSILKRIKTCTCTP